ncbi:hypothetical protein [Aestuariivivens sediminis]|uniref:hypothetical protein n=1 Tax=Aestuariivivens sediminis TaxID=2913557 RepID=UPI001F57CD18|nr:hypothetical protein [Aestuariivivens sediminis]
MEDGACPSGMWKAKNPLQVWEHYTISGLGGLFLPTCGWQAGFSSFFGPAKK